jgi:plastocyanin
MRRAAVLITVLLLPLLLPLLLAACGGTGGTTPPAAASEPATSAAPPASNAASPAAEACAPSTDAATVSVEIANFEYAPADATARVGDVVGWANSDSAPHTATMDDGSCATGNLSAGGGAGALVFNTAGTFPYHCAIHPNMKATLTVTE